VNNKYISGKKSGQYILEKRLSKKGGRRMESKNQPNSGLYESTAQMNEPPNVITTKDLAYLKDALSWELLAMKKCKQFAASATDPEIRQNIDSTGQMHQRHYQKLLQYLKSNPNQQYVQ
jgi:hypothetical protein